MKKSTEELILETLNEFRGRFDKIEADIADFRDDFTFFRKDMYRFKIKTESRLDALFDTMPHIGKHFQDHEDRLLALENVA